MAERSAAAEQRSQELAKSEQQFRTLVEAMPDALIISDKDGRIRLVTRERERLFGYRREELIGQLDSNSWSRSESASDIRPSDSADYRDPRSALLFGVTLTAVDKEGGEFRSRSTSARSPIRMRKGCSVRTSLRDPPDLRRLSKRSWSARNAIA